jgi:hypothetical protein
METLFRPAIERLLGGWIHSLGKEQLRFEGGFSTPVTLELADLRVREDALHTTLALPAVTPGTGSLTASLQPSQFTHTRGCGWAVGVGATHRH